MRTKTLAILLATSLVGCRLDAVDMDGDGWPSPIDCDDMDPDVRPGADEVCNGIDDDCDGLSGQEADFDGDGWLPCEGDCDPAHRLTYPGAAELCDGWDNDCDGDIPRDEVDQDGDGAARCCPWEGPVSGSGCDGCE